MNEQPNPTPRPWPVNPALYPLNPSRRVKGFAYAPPHASERNSCLNRILTLLNL